MYRKKPIVVEAWQYQISPVRDWPEWLQREVNLQRVIFGDGGSISIRTLEGDMRANLGDWIIKGVEGEIYPCKPDIFAATYDQAETERLSDVEIAGLTPRLGDYLPNRIKPPEVEAMPPGARADAMQGRWQNAPYRPMGPGDPDWRAEPIGASRPLIHKDDYRHPNQRATRFRDEIEQVINSHSRENGSDTPDFILAQFVLDVMDAFDKAVTRRTGWYGKDKSIEAQLQVEGEHTAAGQAEIERLSTENVRLRTELQRVSMAGLAPSMVVGK